ncbi:hypothetical protein K466DRAFT_603611 [Polyporus arcularius HHB13444]|uniref:Uncharacterized protein n=1 Tax=Polyporus arcularius HHB13444 TaxID=1314778 RepID=A0A5C3NYK9_9APHY|nr:hypothetical protein K466DRAFT_603611 [Polyporus arcularius HHB13444]
MPLALVRVPKAAALQRAQESASLADKPVLTTVPDARLPQAAPVQQPRGSASVAAKTASTTQLLALVPVTQSAAVPASAADMPVSTPAPGPPLPQAAPLQHARGAASVADKPVSTPALDAPLPHTAAVQQTQGSASVAAKPVSTTMSLALVQVPKAAALQWAQEAATVADEPVPTTVPDAPRAQAAKTGGSASVASEPGSVLTHTSLDPPGASHDGQLSTARRPSHCERSDISWQSSDYGWPRGSPPLGAPREDCDSLPEPVEDAPSEASGQMIGETAEEDRKFREMYMAIAGDACYIPGGLQSLPPSPRGRRSASRESSISRASYDADSSFGIPVEGRGPAADILRQALEACGFVDSRYVSSDRSSSPPSTPLRWRTPDREMPESADSHVDDLTIHENSDLRLYNRYLDAVKADSGSPEPRGSVSISVDCRVDGRTLQRPIAVIRGRDDFTVEEHVAMVDIRPLDPAHASRDLKSIYWGFDYRLELISSGDPTLQSMPTAASPSVSRSISPDSRREDTPAPPAVIAEYSGKDREDGAAHRSSPPPTRAAGSPSSAPRGSAPKRRRVKLKFSAEERTAALVEWLETTDDGAYLRAREYQEIVAATPRAAQPIDKLLRWVEYVTSLLGKGPDATEYSAPLAAQGRTVNKTIIGIFLDRGHDWVKNMFTIRMMQDLHVPAVEKALDDLREHRDVIGASGLAPLLKGVANGDPLSKWIERGPKQTSPSLSPEPEEDVDLKQESVDDEQVRHGGDDDSSGDDDDDGNSNGNSTIRERHASPGVRGQLEVASDDRDADDERSSSSASPAMPKPRARFKPRSPSEESTQHNHIGGAPDDDASADVNHHDEDQRGADTAAGPSRGAQSISTVPGVGARVRAAQRPPPGWIRATYRGFSFEIMDPGAT